VVSAGHSSAQAVTATGSGCGNRSRSAVGRAGQFSFQDDPFAAEAGRRRQQRGRVRVARVAPEVAAGASSTPGRVHHGDAVGQVLDDGESWLMNT